MRQVEVDRVCGRPFAENNVYRVILHRGIEYLLICTVEPVYLIDKEDISLVQIRQHRHQIARLLYRGAGGYAHIDAHLICDDTCKRGFAKSRGAVQENVVKRFSSHFCGVDEHGQIRLCLLLTYIFSQCFRSQRALRAVLRQACRGSYDLIIYIVREIDAHFVFSITLPSASEQS